MELTHLLVVCLFAGLSVQLDTTLAHDNALEDKPIDKEKITEDEQKVYDECRNPDYKKYVKCLMRPKRHHHIGHGDEESETDVRHCMETCLQKCDFSDRDCEKNCSHCTKRTRHRHQIITEYETECVSGKCGPLDKDLKTTNITTNIGINNYINTYPRPPIDGRIPGKIPPGRTPPIDGEPGKIPPIDGEPGKIPPIDGEPGRIPTDGGPGRPPINGNDEIPPGRVPSKPWFPSIPIIPQISLVPQITYEMGFGAAGGCAYNQWLCIQQSGIESIQPDCSGCGNPILRYRCDVTCYKTQINVTAQSLCRNPECVGGSA